MESPFENHTLEGLLRETLDSLPIATLLIDRDFCVLHRNKVASILMKKQSLFIVNSQGKLQSSGDKYRAIFHKKVKSLFIKAEQHSPRESVILTAASYQILLRLLNCGGKYTHIAAFIFDSESKHALNQDHLKSLFQFTTAESKLAVLLAQGLSIDSAKDVLCISRHTARNHLRSMFIKCDVTRQANLVRKIVTSPAMLY